VATARVKVDDLAVGNLPRICAKTGASADGFIDYESGHGGFQPWWLLLLLLGPVGLVVVAVFLVFGRRVNRVGGSVPLSSMALHRYNTAVRVSHWSFLASFAVLVAGIAASVGFRDTWTWAPDLGLVGLVAFGVGLVVTITAGVITGRLWIDAELDGSGRWVALTGVHGVFADAVETRYRQASVDPAR